MWRSLRSLRLARPLTSTRVRLTLWYLAIIAILFLIFSGVIAGTLTNEAYTQEEAALASAANHIAATYDPASCSIAVNGLGQGGVQLAKPLPGKPTVISNAALLGQDGVVVIFDSNRQPCKQVPDGTPQVYGPLTAQGVADLGQRVFGKQPDLDLPATLNAMALEVRKSPTGDVAVASYGVYATRVGEAASSGRILVVGRPFNPYQPVQQLIPALLIGGPLTLLIAAAGGYWLATRALRPVRLITRAAREIGERDLDRRLNLNSHDELGELARTFDGMLDRLQAAFARQRQFTADASHELRTPLTIVDLEVTRALGQPLASEEYERVLAVVQSENAYMARLVGDLLTLARADAGQNILCMEALDLSDVALDVVERMARMAQQAGLSLVASNLPELPVRGDRSSLAQALGNLVENAIKYTLGAGTRVELAAGRSAEDGREWAWVRVTDDGPGIAAEHLPHLCERFYRVDAARARHDADGVTGSGAPDGSGLGLAIVEWVARAHEGALRIRSAIGVGSVFELWLPQR